MKKIYIFTTLLAISCTSYSGLTQLDNQDLLSVTGQGGADLSWTFSLNHQYANDMSLTNISNPNIDGKVTDVANAFYQYNCVGGDNLCRLAISPNNHKEVRKDVNGQVVTKDGKAVYDQKWLVFKKIQGTLQIDRFSLDGTTITNKDKSPQTALMITFYDDSPLKIRNLGFENVSVEAGDTGYLEGIKYSEIITGVASPTFDKGKETGFMGLNVHGNLHMSGNLKIFSYNCSGGSGSRC